MISKKVNQLLLNEFINNFVFLMQTNHSSSGVGGGAVRVKAGDVWRGREGWGGVTWCSFRSRCCL